MVEILNDRRTKLSFWGGREIKALSDKKKPARMYGQQTYPSRNVKRRSSGRLEMVEVRNLDSHRKRKITGEGINESKITFFKKYFWSKR